MGRGVTWGGGGGGGGGGGWVKASFEKTTRSDDTKMDRTCRRKHSWGGPGNGHRLGRKGRGDIDQAKER